MTTEHGRPRVLRAAVYKSLRKSILDMENRNLRTREKSASQMVDWIVNRIGEKVNAAKLD